MSPDLINFTLEDMKEAFEAGKHFGEIETLHLHTDHVSKQQLERTSDWNDYIKSKIETRSTSKE